MKIQHFFSGKTLEGDVEQSSFIITNKKGGYYFGSANNPISKFNGLFFPVQVNEQTKEWDMMKVVESIGIQKPTEQLRNHQAFFELQKGLSTEQFFMNHSDTLVYQVNDFDGQIPLILDSKFIYDDSTKGRIYKIGRSKGCVVVTYEKYADDSLANLQYKCYIAIKSDMRAKLSENWIERQYSLDQERGEHGSRWVFELLTFIAKKNGSVVISFGQKRSEAIRKANDVFENIEPVKKMKLKYAQSLCSHGLKLSKEDNCAFQNALVGFDELIQDVHGVNGIYAGLPWFFHYWARDEAISSIGLIKEEYYGLAKKVLLRWLNTATDGRVSNRFPIANLGSADATGWLFFRIKELILTLQNKGLLEKYFSKTELYYVFKEAVNRLRHIEERYMRDGLLFSKPLETWMDTGSEVGDVRAGFRIEIQALHIAMYDSIIEIGSLLKEEVDTFINDKELLMKRGRLSFFKDGFLKDGLYDETIRPNIFIVAYVSPDLLDKKEWVGCLQKTLDTLFVSYDDNKGGLITIPKDHHLFCAHHSGVNNHSYHRGDSWYWLNLLAATVLKRFGKVKFRSYITALKCSATHALLWQGAAGSLAEVSSGTELTSQGCLSQAWSYALLIEFFLEK